MRAHQQRRLRQFAAIIIVSFALNFFWEHAHAHLYLSYQGGPISDLVLMRATLADAAFLGLLAIPFIYHPVFRSRLWLIIPLGLALAFAIERFALATDRWHYAASMPIIPLLGTGLSPTLQLAATGYLAYWAVLEKLEVS